MRGLGVCVGGCFYIVSCCSPVSISQTVKDERNRSWPEKGEQGLRKLLWSTIPVIIFLPQTVKKQEILVKHLHISTSSDGYIHIFSQPPTVIMTEYTLTALLFDNLIVLVHCFLNWVSANTRRRGLGLFCSCGSLEYHKTWGRTREAEGKT